MRSDRRIGRHRTVGAADQRLPSAASYARLSGIVSGDNRGARKINNRPKFSLYRDAFC